MKRGTVRTGVALLLALVATFVLSGSASAIDRPGILTPPCDVSNKPGCENSKEVVDDCKDAPTPGVPGRGLTGFFTHKPDELPPDADPFAKNASVSIYQVYGYAGIRWNTYDLGCGADVARNPDAVIGTTVANWGLQVPKVMVAATGAVLGSAFQPEFLSVFDPLVGKAVDALQVAVFERWVFLVVAAFGLGLIWLSRSQRLSESASGIGWVLFVMVLLTMVVRWPLVAGHAADQSVTTALTSVSSGLTGADPDEAGSAGESTTSLMHESVLYQTWLAGTFGSSDSATAIEYGPKVFDATALTWREAAVLEQDPDKGAQIIDAKKAKFKEIAEQIKAVDLDAYDNLMGKQSDTRVGYALVALGAALFITPFLFVAALLIIGALVIIRVGVMFFPAFATVGIHPSMRMLVMGIGNTMAAALINCVVYGIGASLLMLGMGVILGADSLAGWMELILMLILTIVFWVALRPFRQLTQMVSKSKWRDSFTNAAGSPMAEAKRAARTAKGVATTAAGVALGRMVTDNHGDNDAQERPTRAEAEPEVTVTGVQDVPRPGPQRARPRALHAAEHRGLPGPPEGAPQPQPPGPPPAFPPAAASEPEPPVLRRYPTRPGDDGQPLEGVVLPKQITAGRYEMEDA